MDVDFDELEVRETDINDANAHPETTRLLAELDRKTSARKLAVPTRDVDVRMRLRELGEPVTLFGERPEDRRDRLRHLWSQIRQREKDAKAAKGSDEGSSDSDDSSDDDQEKEEEFYTEGTLDLKAARRDIAEYSLPRWVSRTQLLKEIDFGIVANAYCPKVTETRCSATLRNKRSSRSTHRRSSSRVRQPENIHKSRISNRRYSCAVLLALLSGLVHAAHVVLDRSCQTVELAALQRNSDVQR